MSKMRIGFLLLKILLLNVILINANITANSWDAYNTRDEFFKRNKVKPVTYKVELTPNFEAGHVHGKITIYLRVEKPTNHIRMFADNITIFKQTIKLSSSSDSAVYTLSSLKYTRNEKIIHMYFTKNLRVTDFLHKLKFRFTSFPFHEDKITSESEVNPTLMTNVCRTSDRPQCLTMMLNKPSAISSLLPCWNEPGIKARFKITINHPPRYKALSNAAMNTATLIRKNILRTEFKFTPRMPAYQLMIAFVENDTCLRNNSEWAVCGSQLNEDQITPLRTIVRDTDKYLTKFTGIPTNSSTNYVIAPDLFVQSSESIGLRIYRRKDVIFDDQLDGIGSQLHKIHILIKGSTHQFFNRWLSPVSWNDIWLNRALGTFFAILIMDKKKPFEEVMMIYVVHYLHVALEKDVNFQMKPIAHEVSNFDEINEYFSPNNYIKDFAIMRMLRRILTPEVFREAIGNFLNANRMRYFRIDEFWAFITSTARDYYYDVMDLGEVMHSWITKSNYPIITVTRNYSSGEVIIKQQHIHNRPSNYSTKWFVPITYFTESDANMSMYMEDIYWLTPENESISRYVNPNEWIVLNLDQAGYYRVNYDYRNWKKLTEHMNSVDYMTIRVENRAQLIDDAYFFMMKMEFHPDMFFHIIAYIEGEDNYVPWYTMERILIDMRFLFRLPHSTLIKEFMLIMFTQLLYDFPKEPKEDYVENTQLLRMLALKWLCRFGHLEYRKQANKQLVHHLEHAEEVISMRKKEWIYCAGLMTADVTTGKKVYDKYREASDYEKEELLSSLSCAEDPLIIITYLNNTKTLRRIADDKSYIAGEKLFNAILSEHIDKPGVLDYILYNYMESNITYGDRLSDLVHIIPYITTKDSLNKILEYVQSYNTSIFKDNYTRITTKYKIKKQMEKIDSESERLEKINLILPELIKINE